MKSRIAVLLIFGLASLTLAADQKTDKKKPTAKAPVITIPANAVEIAPLTYRATDDKGKTWIYRQTPFGVSRTEDKPVSAEDAKKVQESKDRAIDSIKATEDGDFIRFVRESPFGPTEWRKKKTDLNDVEQAVWNRELARRNAPQSASKD